MYIDVRVKCPLFLSHFNETLIYVQFLEKVVKYQIS